MPPRPPELGNPAHAWNGEEWIVGKSAPLPDDP
jgi:hypothetical protein